MSGGPARVILLGPQGDEPDAGRVLAELGVEGAVALVSAGWREWEEEERPLHGALASALGRPGGRPGRRPWVNLRLWQRAERVWREDPELTEGHRTLQRRVRALRRAYNIRLALAMEAWVALLHAQGEAAVLGPERTDALETVRVLDRHHGERLRALREEFRREYDPSGREAVARERGQVAAALEDVEAVVVEGGHVPVLLNRLRLFDLDGLLEGRTLVACSGGAMVLGERVVLFHDSPPWGPGHAELGEVGLGLFRGVIPLPHASVRLRLDDADRVRRLALRFAPDAMVPLDPGVRLEWEDGWRPGDSGRLSESGSVEPWRGAA